MSVDPRTELGEQRGTDEPIARGPHAPPRVVLCGSPGAGKSALAQSLARAPRFAGNPDNLLDPSGDEQYLRHIVHAATAADAAVIVLDDRGLTHEARHDSRLVSVLGIRNLIVAVNKLDLAGYEQARFEAISEEYARFAERIGLERITYVPVCAQSGEHVLEPSAQMRWYEGPSLIELLDPAPPDGRPAQTTAAPPAEPGLADQFEVTIVWLGKWPMLRGRSYGLRIGTKAVAATITPLKYKLRVDSPERLAATRLERGEIGVCEIECSEPIAFNSYRENRETGRFALVDRMSDEVVGIGLIHFALRRSHNIRWQALTIDKTERARALQQQPTALWFTGLSGAGKSTIANLVEGELHRRGHHTYMLDGDNVRHGLNADLGFTDTDRVENIRRVSEVAKLMVDAGLIVIVSFISPFRTERAMARSLFGDREFLEVFVDTPLAVAEQRDPKGLYKKARSGDLVNFTGIDSPYEPPERPEIHLDTTELAPADAAAEVIELLDQWGRLALND